MQIYNNKIIKKTIRKEFFLYLQTFKQPIMFKEDILEMTSEIQKFKIEFESKYNKN